MLFQPLKLHGAVAVLVGLAVWSASNLQAQTPVHTAVLTKSHESEPVMRTANYRPAESQAAIMPVQWGWRGGYVRPYYRYPYYRAPYSYGYYTGPYYYGYSPAPY